MPLGLFDGQLSESIKELQVELPMMTEGEHVVQDYASTGLSLKNHPVALVQDKLKQVHNIKVSELSNRKDGDFVKIADLITVRQRPGTAKGVLFMTLEYETGSANLVVWEKLFNTYRKEIIQSRLLMVAGKLQIANGVTHLVVYRCFKDDRPLLTPARGDETTSLVLIPGRFSTKAGILDDPRNIAKDGRDEPGDAAGL